MAEGRASHGRARLERWRSRRLRHHGSVAASGRREREDAVGSLLRTPAVLTERHCGHRSPANSHRSTHAPHGDDCAVPLDRFRAVASCNREEDAFKASP